MFRIIRDGESVGMTEAPNYIKLTENGSYNLCPEPEASGIVFEGKVYHLLDRPALEGVDTVMLEETDAGTEIVKATEAGGIMFVTMAEGGQIDDTTAAEHADLFAPWAYPVSYKADNIRRYGGKLYRCVKDHTSQEVRANQGTPYFQPRPPIQGIEARLPAELFHLHFPAAALPSDSGLPGT